MRVYSATGEVYDGDSVDCRELMAMGSWTKEPPAEKPVEEAPVTTQSSFVVPPTDKSTVVERSGGKAKI